MKTELEKPVKVTRNAEKEGTRRVEIRRRSHLGLGQLGAEWDDGVRDLDALHTKGSGKELISTTLTHCTRKGQEKNS